MMKTYELYVFTQESCAPCTRLKDHVQTLTEAEQAELKKADEEIAHLKTLLKPKPKKLPKGYIA